MNYKEMLEARYAELLRKCRKRHKWEDKNKDKKDKPNPVKEIDWSKISNFVKKKK